MQHFAFDGAECGESFHHLGSGYRSAAKQRVGCFFPALRGIDAEERIERWVEPDFFAVAIELQADGRSRPHRRIEAYRPEKHRRDARTNIRLRFLHDEKGKAHVQSVDAGVAAIEGRMAVERTKSPFDARLGHEGRRVEADRLLIA